MMDINKLDSNIINETINLIYKLLDIIDEYLKIYIDISDSNDGNNIKFISTNNKYNSGLYIKKIISKMFKNILYMDDDKIPIYNNSHHTNFLYEDKKTNDVIFFMIHYEFFNKIINIVEIIVKNLNIDHSNNIFIFDLITKDKKIYHTIFKKITGNNYKIFNRDTNIKYNLNGMKLAENSYILYNLLDIDFNELYYNILTDTNLQIFEDLHKLIKNNLIIIDNYTTCTLNASHIIQNLNNKIDTLTNIINSVTQELNDKIKKLEDKKNNVIINDLLDLHS